ncbi:hypothetical protein ACFX1T_043456 [Malus domestica]
MQLHKDVPKDARFNSEGLDFAVNVCTNRWAELQLGTPDGCSIPQFERDHAMQNGKSSFLFLTVPDINQTVTNLMALGGAELDGPIKFEVNMIHTMRL